MLPHPLICLVTGDRGREAPLLDLLAQAVRAGIDLIQIRERSLDDRGLAVLTRRAVDMAHGSESRILVNDRPDVAIACGAAGVHLRSNGMPARRIRPFAPPGFIIGRSVHGAAEAGAVESDGGCDYLLFGTVFPSASKPPGHEAAGVESLRRVCASVALPVLAIGGITAGNARDAAEAGAAGVAAISLLARPESLRATVDRLRRSFDT